MQKRIAKFEVWLLKERNSPLYPILFFGCIALAAVAFLMSRAPGLEIELGKISIGLLALAIVIRALKDPVVFFIIPFFWIPMHLLFSSAHEKKAAYETFGFWFISTCSIAIGLVLVIRAILVTKKINNAQQVAGGDRPR